MIDKSLFELPGVRRMFPILGILAVFQFIAIAGQALFLATAITKLWQGQLFSHTIPWVLGFFACFLSREIINFGRSKALDKLAYQLATKLRGDMLDKFFRLGPVAIANLGSGSAATTVITGIDQVENYIKLVLSKVLNMMIIPMLILIPVYFLDWQSGIVLTLTFPFAIIFMILLGYAAQGRAERQYKTFQYLSNHFLDSLRGISTLKYFGLSKDYSNSIYKTSEDFRKETMGALRIAMLSTFALDFFASLSVAVVALFLGLRLMSGDILLFPALAALILAPEYFLPLRDFASDYHATLNGKNALAAVNEVLSTEENTLSVLTEKVTWSANSQLQLTELGKIYDTGRGISNVILSVNGFKKIAIVGNSGSGKSTYLRALNRMNDTIDGARVTGEINYEGVNINENKVNVFEVRKQIGMVFQRPNPFPKSIYENIAFIHRRDGVRDRKKLDEIVETSLKQAALWDQVKDNLNQSALAMSGGQAQRLCIARALSVKPEIILMDEPASALDPISTMQIEETMMELKENYTIIIVTHNMAQASRASDNTAFFYSGDLIEYDKTSTIFTQPSLQSTEDYVSGHFG